MSIPSATYATIDLIDVGVALPEKEKIDFQNLFYRWARRREFQASKNSAVGIDTPNVGNFSPVTPWLQSVVRRIEEFTIPNEYEELRSTEWLSEEVGQAAVRFFQSVADVLPGEPYIYSSRQGALVAEFEADMGRMTVIVSPDAIILFAVNNDKPDEPVEKSLEPDSNRIREEMKKITRILTDAHGQMGSTS